MTAKPNLRTVVNDWGGQKRVRSLWAMSTLTETSRWMDEHADLFTSMEGDEAVPSTLDSPSSAFVLAVIVTTVMLAVGNNFVGALGVFGALAMIRFRTPVKDANDTVFLFLAVAVGIAKLELYNNLRKGAALNAVQIAEELV